MAYGTGTGNQHVSASRRVPRDRGEEPLLVAYVHQVLILNSIFFFSASKGSLLEKGGGSRDVVLV